MNASVNVEDISKEAAAEVSTEGWLSKLDAWVEKYSEWLNPILVKEARQSLKSWSFVLTFSMVLLAAWGWTAISVTIFSSQSMQESEIQLAFMGFLVILIVPLMVIVPFLAFRSLASERDDGTFELVSITTLAARQIVQGKLASAVLQVMIYFSVLAPCITFTYMLRGISINLIVVSLGYTLLFSIGLTCIALMMAASVQSIHWQILATVKLLGWLSFAAIMWIAFNGEVLLRNDPLAESDSLVVIGFSVSMLLAISALCLGAAVGMLSFESDNRSTRLRVLMLVVQSVFIGWVVYIEARNDGMRGFLPAMCCIVTAYWAVMGAMMTGENPDLSPRVRRSLPKSLLGRMAFTWFNPGSASGYVFAVLNAASFLLILLAFYSMDRSNSAFDRGIMGAVAAVLYLAIYLGIGRMMIRTLRRLANFGVIVALLLQCLLAVFGILMPLILQMLISWGGSFRYSLVQLPNWAWTIGEAFQFRTTNVGGDTITILGVGAGIIFLVNVVVGGREIRQLREETPERVLEEQRIQLGIPAQEASEKPRSPFDD